MGVKTGDSNPFMTAYVLWGLSLARDSGVEVREGVLENAARWLSRELVEAHTARISAHDARLGAVIELNPDAAALAEQRDAERAAGDPATRARIHLYVGLNLAVLGRGVGRGLRAPGPPVHRIRLVQ